VGCARSRIRLAFALQTAMHARAPCIVLRSDINSRSDIFLPVCVRVHPTLTTSLLQRSASRANIVASAPSAHPRLPLCPLNDSRPRCRRRTFNLALSHSCTVFTTSWLRPRPPSIARFHHHLVAPAPPVTTTGAIHDRERKSTRAPERERVTVRGARAMCVCVSE